MNVNPARDRETQRDCVDDRERHNKGRGGTETQERSGRLEVLVKVRDIDTELWRLDR